MKLIEKIDRHEVLRRWAIGEVYSEFYRPLYNSGREETMDMLLSGNHYLEKEAIAQVLEFKQNLVDSMSLHIKWYSAMLEINKSDLDLVYTCNYRAGKETRLALSLSQMLPEISGTYPSSIRG